VVHKQEEIERYREFIPAEDERKDAGRDQPGAASSSAIATRTRARVGSRPAKVRRIA
jgi:hypothetical protein